MTELTSFQQRLLDFLTGRHPATITYQELARAMDPDVNPRDRRFKRLTPPSTTSTSTRWRMTAR